MAEPLKAVVVGLRMGAGHAKCYAEQDNYTLAGLCDIDAELLKSVGERLECDALYTDYSKMLAEIKPDVVAVATSTHLHMQMTLEAVDSGARLVYCEKPIDISLGNVLKMKGACEKAGACFIIGHQRRVSTPYKAMREQIVQGAIGDLLELRGSLPGDLLSDVTHTVDSMIYLTGDAPVEWVLGQMFRGRKATPEELAVSRFKYCGTRYGHNVEEGAMSAFAFKTGVRATIYSGTVALPKHGYQDIEVIGSKGFMRRAGDAAKPAVTIDTGSGPRVLVQDNDDSGLKEAHRLAAETLLNGAVHPMDISFALPGFEVIMALMESARLRARIDLPISQMEYPLDIMLRNGDME
ncbi:MAG: Gfo/Idh/MocA family oxidoreductase [Oscillospiraceae bacterium]|nr:Gfo/Idh/MocA family oxidoreductase [Oscillospiraceae bacterium]